MKNRLAVVGLLVAAGAASDVLAQTDFVLVLRRTDDLTAICKNRYSTGAEMQSGVQYFVGTNPISIAFDGTSYFIAGDQNASTLSRTNAASGLPMARIPTSNTPTDFGGGVVNPITGRVVVAGEPLTEVVPQGDDNWPLGVYWSHGLVKITINPDGTRAFVANKFMRSSFREVGNGTTTFGFITPENPSGVVNFGLELQRNTNLDFAPDVGLLMTFDNGTGVFNQGKIRWYDTTTQINPILRTPSPTSQAASDNRLIGGAAWDFGPAGQGFDYKTGTGANTTFTPDGVSDGPVASVLINPTDPSPTQYGPIGLDKERLAMDFAPTDPGASGNVVYHAGFGGSSPLPALNFGPKITPTPNRILWRDIAINPVNGVIVARASNDLIYAYRNADGTTDPTRTGRIASSFDGAFSRGQKVGVIHSVAGAPDAAVWNDLTLSGAQPMTSVLRFSKLDGVVPPADATVAVVEESIDPVTGQTVRTPATVTLLGNIADVHYHAPSGKLAVLDYVGRVAYLFDVESGTPVTPGCLADVTLDGTVDGSDFIAFINSFGIGDASIDPTADVITDGTIDGTDFIEFINAFSAGC